MTKKLIVAACVLTLITAGASLTAWGLQGKGLDLGCGLFDCPGMGHFAGKLGRFLVLRSQLDITDNQKEKISVIVKGRMGEIVPVAKVVLAKRKALREEVLKKTPDEKAIRAAAGGLAESIGNAAVLASGIIGDVRPVLTPDQVKLILDFKTDSHKATVDWLDRRGKK